MECDEEWRLLLVHGHGLARITGNGLVDFHFHGACIGILELRHAEKLQESFQRQLRVADHESRRQRGFLPFLNH